MCFQQREKLLSSFSNFGKGNVWNLVQEMQNSKKLQTIFLQQKIEFFFYFPYFVAEVSHMAQQIAINYCNFKKKKKKKK